MCARKYLEHMPYNVGAWRALAQLGEERERERERKGIVRRGRGRGKGRG